MRFPVAEMNVLVVEGEPGKTAGPFRMLKAGRRPGITAG